MNSLQNPLVIKSHRDLNVTRHVRTLEKERYADQDGRAYCMCGHKPTIVPIERVVDGKKCERFVAMCNTCMPGGAMHLEEHKAPYLALSDFDVNCRLTIDGGERYAV